MLLIERKLLLGRLNVCYRQVLENFVALGLSRGYCKTKAEPRMIERGDHRNGDALMLRWQAEDTPFVTTAHRLPDKPDGLTLLSAIRPILSDAFEPAPPARMNVIRCFGL
ncbi:hypothetical protein EVC45_43515 [Paraburkholderia sp. UYCP14C]|uniref:hypothetical protein n=1 Tax=Paraburkholderia sp. UYCP14C TaxID=2511130 RepID=UPI001020E7D6|nr:hypothetical protein [Paraburkholderia sp. UYCP14C]RZF23596.1 hypothetical protein EVC45_43515 [Paraburkholderia sp. UYCP14C]